MIIARLLFLTRNKFIAVELLYLSCCTGSCPSGLYAAACSPTGARANSKVLLSVDLPRLCGDAHKHSIAYKRSPGPVQVPHTLLVFRPPPPSTTRVRCRVSDSFRPSPIGTHWTSTLAAMSPGLPPTRPDRQLPPT
uniref:Secreted protein n=1 Tax=Mycena chlorophos TaxID=658473 RepID=A0ABQ0LCM0_MYCCL|nr:predicted protein [Mycena chlorophos]